MTGWVDIVGWFVVNAVLGAGAPAIGMAAMLGLNRLLANQQHPLNLKIHFFAPYRDAQRDFVVAGWAVGAMAKLAKSDKASCML